jgi:hypothetical protein
LEFIVKFFEETINYQTKLKELQNPENDGAQCERQEDGEGVESIVDHCRQTNGDEAIAHTAFGHFRPQFGESVTYHYFVCFCENGFI